MRQRKRGQTVLFVAVGLIVFLGLLAFVVDFGRLFLTRQMLRNYADAAALAGAQNLPDTATAKLKAVEYYAKNLGKTFDDAQWISTSGDTDKYQIGGDTVSVTSPYSDSKTQAGGVAPNQAIRVKACRTITHHIAQVLGVRQGTRCGEAVAIIGGVTQVSEGDQVVPIGYPVAKPEDFDSQSSAPYTAPADMVVGTEYNYSIPDGVHGNNFFVDLPRPGGNQLRDNFKFGAQGTWKIGDIVKTEPGLNNGPVEQGVNYRVDQCPTATYDNFDPDTCPREVTILIVDTSIDTYNGKSNVEIVGFARIFLNHYENTGSPEVPRKTAMAVFMPMRLTSGPVTPGAPVFNLAAVGLYE